MILVTGGTGLVGAHLLLELLKSGEKVRAIHRKNSNLEAVQRVFTYEHTKEVAKTLFHQIEWFEADITDIPALEKAFEGITRVYHCAALVSFDPSKYLQLRKSNIEGTANVVNCCIRNEVEKLCHVSSIATFDKKLGEDIISEDSHWNKEENHSFYAITKYGAEMEVWRASQEGVPVVIVNPGIIIGPGFWNSGSGLLFKRIHKGWKFHFPKVTGFVGVKDVVQAMRQIMGTPVKNEKFILVSQNLAFHDVLEKAARSIDKPGPTKQLKPWMVFSGWIFQKTFSFFTGNERQLSQQHVKSLFEETYYSSKKIKNEINFTFEKIDSVIERTGRFFRKDFE